MFAYCFLIRSDSRKYRLWLTWVLCLCAWRGPIPIVHRHSLESQVLAANLDLAAHAVHHHGHDIGHGDSGWHLHFVWPSGGDTPADEEHGAPTLAWPCVVDESARGLCAGEFAPTQAFFSDMATAAPLTLASIGPTARRLPRPEIKSKRISPQAALCVARC